MARETKTHDPAGEHVREPTLDLTGFDYSAAAELFLNRSRAAKRGPRYRRFDTAAEAVRFVVESLPAAVLPGAYLLIDDVRLSLEQIRSLYDSAGYPLARAIETC